MNKDSKITIDLRNLNTQLFQAIGIFPLPAALALKFPVAVQMHLPLLQETSLTTGRKRPF